jgi:hypothetical protein
MQYQFPTTPSGEIDQNSDDDHVAALTQAEDDLELAVAAAEEHSGLNERRNDLVVMLQDNYDKVKSPSNQI